MKWTELEIQFLKDNYPTHGVRFCMERFGRSRDAIKRKASDLGIKFIGDNPIKRTNKEYDNLLFENEIDCIRIENYVDNRTPILHRCIEGHEWKATPYNILNRSGCPSCASFGFDPTKPAILYLMYIENYNVYKLGITNQINPLNRFPIRDRKLMEVKWIIPYSIGYKAKEMETRLQKQYAHSRVHLGNILESGNSECFMEYIPKDFI